MTHSFPTRRSAELVRHRQNRRSKSPAAKPVMANPPAPASAPQTKALRRPARSDHMAPNNCDSAHTSMNTAIGSAAITRSEEHTSELQSLMRISYAVFCLKKQNKNRPKLNKQ